MTLMVQSMKKPEDRKRGRPKGSGYGGLGASVAFRVSVEYKVWLESFAEAEHVSSADIFREAMREYADRRTFRRPPIK